MRRQGFTLLEVLVVIALLGLLLALAAPALQGALSRSRVTEAASTVAGGLRAAGGQALTRSEAVTVSVTGGGTSLTWQNSAGTLVNTLPLPPRTTISGIVPAGPVLLSGRGLPVSQYVLTLQSGSVTRTVALLVTGKVVLP